MGMSWQKTWIKLPDGQAVEAQTPVIISASRSTDIPAFYSEWLSRRLEAGFVKWVNPFNGMPLYVSFEKTRLFVFWTKNPKPMFPMLDSLDQHGFNYYFQYTLNDYGMEGYEPCVPPLDDRVQTFISLSKRLGKERVIWRFDPLLLTPRTSVRELLAKVERIGDMVVPYTSRFVFSFSDIEVYGNVQNNLEKGGVGASEFTVGQMHEFAEGIQQLNQKWKLAIGTCAEKLDLQAYGIEHNRCVDDRLLVKLFPQDASLMAFLGYEMNMFGVLQPIGKRRNLKDNGQREACGCIMSKDIGAYNTCPHLCVYCYANAQRDSVLQRFRSHKTESEFI